VIRYDITSLKQPDIANTFQKSIGGNMWKVLSQEEKSACDKRRKARNDMLKNPSVENNTTYTALNRKVHKIHKESENETV